MSDNIETLRVYDKCVAGLLDLVIDVVTNERAVGLYNFDCDNAEHMLVLHVAAIYCGMFGKKLVVNLPWTQWIRMRLNGHKIVRGKSLANLNVPIIIDKIYEKCEDAAKLNGGIGEIYDAYYAEVRIK